jgi:NADH:ubiquinone oxidoreductase subunit F (NADH-binding)/(2Fe-2S) ferredoxin/NAD-dependent dihydropyrimidine dehydrogenase PreA subunit
VPSLTLEKLAAEQKRLQNEWDAFDAHLMVCHCTTCLAAGATAVFEALKGVLADKGLTETIDLAPTGATGFCADGPVCLVQPQGIFYGRVKASDTEELVQSHFVDGKPLERLFHQGPGGPVAKEKDIPFLDKQQEIVFRNRGRLNPLRIEDALRCGAYQAIAKIVAEGQNHEQIIDEIVRSGIRGRGGGGFPAGVKWKSALAAANKRNESPYVVCNADEGDPGAYMDRSIIEADPHAVIEGMLIGARAIGATEGFVYMRQEYPLAMERLELALEQARAWGILGDAVLGSEMSFDIAIHRGAGAFVCGESTALFTSMEGRAGEPRPKYVRSVEYGYRDAPTVLNNVETWANIPEIITRGSAWFAGIGTGDVSDNPWGGSSGTKVFSLVGSCKRSGLVEVPMGITLRELVYDIGGGLKEGRTFKAIQTGGPSGGCLPEEKLDLPVDFDTLQKAGSMMGSGGLIVLDDKSCMVDVARYFTAFLVDESCGKCTPCREGLFALKTVLERICKGAGQPGDLDFLKEISATVMEASLCQLGAAGPNPVMSTLRYFEEEYRKHVEDKCCPAGVCTDLVTYTIADCCTGCLVCLKPCPTGAISGEKKKLHVIDQETCIKCGVCAEVCKFDAVEVR